MESIEQLKATYAGMTEDELADVASDAYDLTDTAQQALREEISIRGLEIEVKIAPWQPSVLEPVTDDDEDEYSDLVVVAAPRSRNDAAKIQAVLNAAGVRSCLGPDNLDNVEPFQGSFEKGVDLKVYFPFAGKASNLIEKLQKSIPPELEYGVQAEDGEEEDDDEYLIRCPKCHSENITFDSQDSDDDETAPEVDEEAELEVERDDLKISWHCDSCGYEWEEDGTEENR